MKALLFDMDGVLVDVSCSYRQTIKEVVSRLGGGTVTMEEIDSFKDAGGYNNDWELTAALLLTRGKKISYHRVVSLFQEIYLGDDFNGLIQHEKLLIKRAILKDLCGVYQTGVVTGRPRKEAEYTLHRFALNSFFTVIITMDDIPVNRGKPDPYGVLQALRQLNCKRGYFLGDTVDDITAALRAGLIPLAVNFKKEGAQGREKLFYDTGARQVLANVNDLQGVINGS